MSDSLSYANSECPPKFYKYRSLAGESSRFAEKIVCQNEIYFPAPSSFNDPFDCRPTFSFEATDEQITEHYMRLARKFRPAMSDEALRRDAQQMLVDPTRSPRNPLVTAGIQEASPTTSPLR